MYHEDRIKAPIWGIWQDHFFLFHPESRTVGSAATPPVILLSINQTLKYRLLLLWDWTVYVVMAYPPRVLAHLSSLGVEQTTTTEDGVSCSDPPYLLYHLSTACWIVAAFFSALHASFKTQPPPQTQPTATTHFPSCIFWKLSEIRCHFCPARDGNLWKGMIKAEK